VCVYQGDVAFLESIRTQEGLSQEGTRLVVGLLSDADVATATGNPFLPIVPLQERALALLSNRAVDDVLLGAPLELTASFVEEHGERYSHRALHSERGRWLTAVG